MKKITRRQVNKLRGHLIRAQNSISADQIPDKETEPVIAELQEIWTIIDQLIDGLPE